MSAKSPIPGLRFQWNKVFINEARRKLKVFSDLVPKLRSRKGLLYLRVLEYEEKIEELEAKLEDTLKRAGFVARLSDYMPDITHKTRTVPVIVAGVEINEIEAVDIDVEPYSLFGTPPILDQAVAITRKRIEEEESLRVNRETMDILEEEFEEVSRQLAVFEDKFVPWLQEAIGQVKQRISDLEALGAGIAGKVKSRHAAADAEAEATAG
ncbi:V-type ATP synthase subunit D [Candidatus Hydrogenedentota bacterium]